MTIEPDPNDLCPCGSGKKFKKCHMNTKPRQWSTSIQFEKPATELRAFSNGTIQGFDNGVPVQPAKVHYETSYNRKKKKKVINKIELDPNQSTVNFGENPDELLQKFDLIYAIDTNTKNANGKLISATCIILCKLEIVENGTIVECRRHNGLEFRNIKDHPENVAWMKVIQLLTQETTYNPNNKICIIVDSDLGNLPAYNNRSLPIYSNFYLPENFTLIYASADVGKGESLTNFFISVTDDSAKSLLDAILLNEGSDVNLQEVNNEPYTHFRMWIPPH